MPLIYYSFKEAVLALWERFCILHGIEKLYTNTDTLWHFIKNRDLEGAEKWSECAVKDAIAGNEQIYY